MITVFEPQDELLKRFVDSIYIFRKGADKFEFTAYPSPNIPVGLLRNAVMDIAGENVFIRGSEEPSYCAVACNQFSNGIHLQYEQLVDEISVNFKPLGFVSFTRSKPSKSKVSYFRQWDAHLPGLFADVFAMTDSKNQLERIERFLLEKYVPIPDEAVLLRALELLNDTDRDNKMEEIAAMTGLHYKSLYRSFTENVGCSPAHYRKLVKFRTAVVSKIQKGDKARLVDICYDHDYTDQPYYIKRFREFTGEKPTGFFREVSSFGKEKVIFKIV